MNYFTSMLSFVGMCLGMGDNPYSVPVVNTNSGLVQGKYIRAIEKDVTAFLGIPFAEPPVGELRFRKPVPVSRWTGTLDATRKPPPCMQYSSRNLSWVASTKPDENCLYLNVWVPERCLGGAFMSPQKLPVFVWIHGGGYAAGSSDMDIYDGAVLSAFGNAVVVSMNYRLGMLGFLNAGSKSAPGNMGLHDQNLALRWIKENVEYFGGDPNSITLVGESAGAVSVGMHMISPLSRKLFRRAIMQSGSPYHPVLAETAPVSMFKANIIAGIVGCSDDRVNFFSDAERVLECLRGKDPFQFAVAEEALLQKMPFLFLPSVDGDFLSASPITAMNNKQFSDVDLLIGNMKNEGTLFLNYLIPEVFSLTEQPLLNMEAARQIVYGLFMNSTSPPPEVVVDFYLRNVDGNNPDEIVDAIANSYGDFVFTCPSLLFAEKLKNVYYYENTHRRTKTPEAAWTGAAHFSDVPFTFGIPITDGEGYTSEECIFSQDIIDKWMTFVRYGNPLSSGSTERWPKFNSDTAQTKELNPRSSDITKHPRWKACSFWRQYFDATAR